jgi:TctA family transporter
MPAAPLLLGFVLGPLIEAQFRRAMVLARGDFGDILTRPIAGTVLAISGLMLVWTLYGALRHLSRNRRGNDRMIMDE